MPLFIILRRTFRSPLSARTAGLGCIRQQTREEDENAFDTLHFSKRDILVLTPSSAFAKLFLARIWAACTPRRAISFAADTLLGNCRLTRWCHRTFSMEFNPAESPSLELSFFPARTAGRLAILCWDESAGTKVQSQGNQQRAARRANWGGIGGNRGCTPVLRDMSLVTVCHHMM